MAALAEAEAGEEYADPDGVGAALSEAWCSISIAAVAVVVVAVVVVIIIAVC